MTITFSALGSWRAAPLGVAGDALKTAIESLDSAHDLLKNKAVPDSWAGLAADAAIVLRDSYCGQLERLIEEKRKIRAAFYAAQPLVEEIERSYKSLMESASMYEFAIGYDGEVLDISETPQFTSRYEAEEWSRSRKTWVEMMERDITTLLSKAAEADAVLANGIPAGHVEDVDENGVVPPKVAAQWVQMTDEERRALIKAYIEELAAEAGVDMPDILWMNDTDGTRGSWNDSEGVLRLNEGLLSDPNILNTVAHEMRHARQYEAVRDCRFWHWPWENPFEGHEQDGISRNQTEVWDENLKDYTVYVPNDDNYEDYFNQPVEVDARAAGKKAIEEMTAEELRRLAEEGAS